MQRDRLGDQLWQGAETSRGAGDDDDFLHGSILLFDWLAAQHKQTLCGFSHDMVLC
jgi:hypothetical protein